MSALIGDLKQRINKDFIATAFNQFWTVLSGPLLLILIPTFLSPEVQGYWFTFSSLIALSVFADLGFSFILLQFSAHEFAYLNFESNTSITGDESHLIHLASLFRFALKW